MLPISFLANNTQYVRKLAGEYQIWIREELPIFLVMTGLYENIYDLQNVKSLTFLHRAPKVYLWPFNYAVIANNYQGILKIERRDAVEMAKLTKGYAPLPFLDDAQILFSATSAKPSP